MIQHPTPKELQRFLEGSLRPARFRRVLLHVSRCGRCQVLAEEALVFDPELVDESTPPAYPPEAYDAAFERALERTLRVTRRVVREREEAAPVVAARAGEVALPPLSGPGSDGLLQGFGRVEALLEISRGYRHRDPDCMIRHAELALQAVRKLEPRRYGFRSLADLRARVWAELANAHRVADDLAAAEAGLENAVRWAKRGTGDLSLAARIGDLAASLWSDLGRFPLAIDTLERVREVYLELGEAHLAGRALISRGIFEGYGGEPERAILDLLAGLAEIDPETEPGLTLSAWHNVALNLVECARYRPALAVMFRTRSLYWQDGKRLNLLRLSWLEGKIHSVLERFDRAEEALQAARIGFEEVGKTYDAALASLDLAMLWCRAGRREAVFQLTTEMLSAFHRHGIAREAIAVLVMARDACAGHEELEELRTRFFALSRFMVELQRGHAPATAKP